MKVLPRPIPRVTAPLRELDLRPGLRNTPVVLVGAAASWPAITSWSFERVTQRYGNVAVPVRQTDDELVEFFGDHQDPGVRPRKMMTLSEYISAITGPRKEGIRLPYAGNISILNDPAVRHRLSALKDECRFPSVLFGDVKEEYRLWIGGPGQRSTIHNDPMHNFNAQIVGRKRFILFAPDEHSNVYAEFFHTGLWASPVDVRAPDLERHPRFEEAKPWICELDAGDLLYIPIFWWHYTDALTPCININRWVEEKGRPQSWHLQPEARAFISPEEILRSVTAQFSALPAELQTLQSADFAETVRAIEALLPVPGSL